MTTDILNDPEPNSEDQRDAFRRMKSRVARARDAPELIRALEVERAARLVGGRRGDLDNAGLLDMEWRSVAYTGEFDAIQSAIGDADEYAAPVSRSLERRRQASLIASSCFLVAAGVLVLLLLNGGYEGVVAWAIGTIGALCLLASGIFTWTGGRYYPEPRQWWVWLLRFFPFGLVVALATAVGFRQDWRAAGGLVLMVLLSTAVLYAIDGSRIPRSRSLRQPAPPVDSPGGTRDEFRSTLSQLYAEVGDQGRRARRASMWWLGAFSFLAALATLAATGAGVAVAMQDLNKGLAAALALLGAAAAALSTALNPGAAWKAAQQRSRNVAALRREIAVMIANDLHRYDHSDESLSINGGLSREAIEYVLEKIKSIEGAEGASFRSLKTNSTSAVPGPI